MPLGEFFKAFISNHADIGIGTVPSSPPFPTSFLGKLQSSQEYHIHSAIIDTTLSINRLPQKLTLAFVERFHIVCLNCIVVSPSLIVKLPALYPVNPSIVLHRPP